MQQLVLVLRVLVVVVKPWEGKLGELGHSWRQNSCPLVDLLLQMVVMVLPRVPLVLVVLVLMVVLVLLEKQPQRLVEEQQPHQQ